LKRKKPVRRNRLAKIPAEKRNKKNNTPGSEKRGLKKKKLRKTENSPRRDCAKKGRLQVGEGAEPTEPLRERGGIVQVKIQVHADLPKKRMMLPARKCPLSGTNLAGRAVGRRKNCTKHRVTGYVKRH